MGIARAIRAQQILAKTVQRRHSVGKHTGYAGRDRTRPGARVMARAMQAMTREGMGHDIRRVYRAKREKTV